MSRIDTCGGRVRRWRQSRAGTARSASVGNPGAPLTSYNTAPLLMSSNRRSLALTYSGCAKMTVSQTALREFLSPTAVGGGERERTARELGANPTRA